MPYSNMTFTVSTGLAFVVNDFIQISAIDSPVTTTTTTTASLFDFIVAENNDPLITEDGNNLIVDYVLPPSPIITEAGDFIITEDGNNLTTQ